MTTDAGEPGTLAGFEAFISGKTGFFSKSFSEFVVVTVAEDSAVAGADETELLAGALELGMSSIIDADFVVPCRYDGVVNELLVTLGA